MRFHVWSGASLARVLFPAGKAVTDFFDRPLAKMPDRLEGVSRSVFKVGTAVVAFETICFDVLKNPLVLALVDCKSRETSAMVA